MKLRRSTAVLAVVLSLVALLAPTGGAGAADSVTIRLEMQNNSGQSGTAELTDMGGGMTKVVLMLTDMGATPQPVHIHEGTCATLNPKPKYPLTNLVNGKSETMVQASLRDLLAENHAINVHKSAQESAVYTACGDLVARKGGAGMATATGTASRATMTATRTATMTATRSATMTATRTATVGAMPRTGGGGTAAPPAPLPWVVGPALLFLTLAGAAYALRRRQI